MRTIFMHFLLFAFAFSVIGCGFGKSYRLTKTAPEAKLLTSYTLASEYTVAVGDPLWRVQLGRVWRAFVATQDFDPPRDILHAHARMGRPIKTGEVFLVSGSIDDTVNVIESETFDPLWGLVVSEQGWWWGGWYSRDRSKSFGEKHSSAQAYFAPAPDAIVPDRLRAELIYTGRTGSVVTAEYREYVDDMRHPQSVFPLRYDLSRSMMIIHKSIKTEVRSATNSELVVAVLEDSGFSWRNE